MNSTTNTATNTPARTRAWNARIETDALGRTACSVEFARIDEHGDRFAASVTPGRGPAHAWTDRRALRAALETLGSLGDPPLVPMDEADEHAGPHPIVLGYELGERDAGEGGGERDAGEDGGTETDGGAIKRVLVSGGTPPAFTLVPKQAWRPEDLRSLVALLSGKGRTARVR